MDVEIRPENKDDFNAVFKVNTLAFGRDREAKLVDLLRKSNAFMAIELTPGGLKRVSGLVQYPKEFDAV